MKAQDIADEIILEQEDISLSAAVVTSFIKNNIGKVNLLLHTELAINDVDYEITPEPTEEEKVVIKLLYLVYYYGKMINTGLGAQAFTAVTEIQDDGTRTRFVNKNEIAKTFLTLQKEAKSDLQDLVNGYRRMKGLAVSVDGNDVLMDIIVNKYTRGRQNV